MKVGLENQIAMVTGASQGLGRACAVGLAANGAHVICVARNAEKLAATVAEKLQKKVHEAPVLIYSERPFTEG